MFDSGAEFEQLLANLLPDEFNANHEENDSLDNRSDNKGPEPEGVTLGSVRGKLYAFVGLERIGGILVLDLTDPKNPEFVDYHNNRQFRDAAGEPVPTCASFDPPDSDDIGDCIKPNAGTGDLGPEGLEFVPARDAPRGKPLLIVGNEVSGTTRLRASLNKGNVPLFPVQVFSYVPISSASSRMWPSIASSSVPLIGCFISGSTMSSA